MNAWLVLDDIARAENDDVIKQISGCTPFTTLTWVALPFVHPVAHILLILLTNWCDGTRATPPHSTHMSQEDLMQILTIFTTLREELAHAEQDVTQAWHRY